MLTIIFGIVGKLFFGILAFIAAIVALFGIAFFIIFKCISKMF